MTIEQTVNFKGTTASALFQIFVDPAKHSAIHGGATAKISAKEGEKFSLLDGNLTGKNLLIVPNRMIVQAWRGNVWEEEDLDSVLTLVFQDTKDGAKIMMTHSFTPPQFDELWDIVYWKPIRNFLKK